MRAKIFQKKIEPGNSTHTIDPIYTATDKIARYENLYQRLVVLDSRRQAQQKRLAQYRQLEVLLEPLKNPQENIQPNLITRDGELIQEIDKMRMLVGRVGGRVRKTPSSQLGTESSTISAADPDDKLAALLELT
jgi:hypothetical protein